jgi:hypothetical protein
MISTVAARAVGPHRLERANHRCCVRRRGRVPIPGLLGLERQEIPLVPADHEDDPAAGAHAADADHLACHVDHAEASEQMASFRGETVCIPLDQQAQIPCQSGASGSGEQIAEG